MARLSDRDELLAAWRALASNPQQLEGWNTIPLALDGPRRLRAGRRCPENDEALLVGFTGVRVPRTEQLPQGQGFLVSSVDLGAEGKLWLALSRRTGASLDLFTMMATDVIEALDDCRTAAEEQVLHYFLARIRAWQDFMRRGTDKVLSAEAEIGLFGELLFLRSIITAGMHSGVAIQSWRGPIHGTQDYSLGTGAVEVKTTIATSGFPATIGSLDQLDDSLQQPLFLAAVRLQAQSASAGTSLPQMVGEIRTLLAEDPPAEKEFNIKLLHAGYLDAASDQYQRTFAHVMTRILLVTDQFPRLTRANLPLEIIEARYEIDCDRIHAENIVLAKALEQLGVI